MTTIPQNAGGAGAPKPKVLPSGGSVIIINIGDLVTLAPLSQGGSHQTAHKKILLNDIGRTTCANAWLVVTGGKVVATGSGKIPGGFANLETIDAKGQLVLPGLVDAHTHLLFSGSRAHEFADRLEGATYQEIAAKGGGIQFTVKKTRQTESEVLKNLALQRLQIALGHGITTLEVKSGYALSVAEELRQLQIISEVKKEAAQHIVTTCLALHAVPPDQNKETFIREVCLELLPRVAAGKLATYVDAFVEAGYFSVEDIEDYIRKAKELGLGIRVHADEFTDAGAALAAGRWRAASADHLQFASQEGAAAMARAGVVAILLPGTSLYAGIPFAKAKLFREAGCQIAVASDWNPGSCGLHNLPMLTSVAALHCGLSAAEAIVAVTHAPACSLGLRGKKGSLAVGADGDFLLHPAGSVEEWLADMGQTPPSQVWINGEVQKL